MPWLVGLALSAVVGAGIVAGLVREPTALEPGSPEATVQTYLQAILDGQWVAAREQLASDLTTRCSATDFRNSWVPEGITVALDDSRSSDGGAEVTVQMRSLATPGPFTGNSGVSTEVFDLTRQDGEWRITGSPWPVYDCRGWW